jgi:hypothetical protein
MPGLPEIKFDISSFKSSITTFLAAPVLPGICCLGGFELCRPGSLGTFLALTSLGYYAKLIVITVVLYIAGLVAWLVVAVVSSLIVIVSVRFHETSVRQIEREMRIKLCRVYFSQLSIAELLPKEINDKAWETWFATVASSLGEEWGFLPSYMNLFTSLEAAAVVIAVSLPISRHHNPWLWVLTIAVFLCACFGVFVTAHGEIGSDDLSARLLERIEKAALKESKSGDINA